MILTKPCEPAHEIHQRVGVRRRVPAVAGHQTAGLPALDEAAGIVVGQRREPEAGLADQLGQDAARTERDQRPEDRILDEAGQELDAACDHRLDDEGSADPFPGAANLVGAREVEDDPALLGLVGAGLGGLDDNREAELYRECGGLVGVGGEPLGNQ